MVPFARIAHGRYVPHNTSLSLSPSSGGPDDDNDDDDGVIIIDEMTESDASGMPV
jgi:hypothetical protein